MAPAYGGRYNYIMNRICLALLGLALFSACPRFVPGVDCDFDRDCAPEDECIARLCIARAPLRTDAGVAVDASGADVSAADVVVDASSSDAGDQVDAGILVDAGAQDVVIVSDANSLDAGASSDVEVQDVGQIDAGQADVQTQDVIGVDVDPGCVVQSPASLIGFQGSVENPGQDGSTRRLFVRNVVNQETWLVSAAVVGDPSATLSAINANLSDFESQTFNDITILTARGEVSASGNASIQVNSALIGANAPIVVGIARYRPNTLTLVNNPIQMSPAAYSLNAPNDESLALLAALVYRDRSHVYDAAPGSSRRFSVFGLNLELAHEPACAERSISGVFSDSGASPISATHLRTLAPQ